MNTQKLLSSFLLTGMLVALAPAASAQRSATYSACNAVRPSACSHGYVTSRVWVPGHYESVCERVWVPGLSQRVWVDPIFELRYDSCGNALRVLASPGHWKTIQQPGHFEDRSVRLWTPGHWEARGARY